MCIQNKSYAKAVAVLEAAEDTNYHLQAAIRCRLGEAYAMTLDGDERAMAEYRKALFLVPDHTHALRLMEDAKRKTIGLGAAVAAEEAEGAVGVDGGVQYDENGMVKVQGAHCIGAGRSLIDKLEDVLVNGYSGGMDTEDHLRLPVPQKGSFVIADIGVGNGACAHSLVQFAKIDGNVPRIVGFDGPSNRAFKVRTMRCFTIQSNSQYGCEIY